ncbi:MAG: ArnT family glycosyltransferase [Planctomycetota bacterium]|jgi:hypothetical protein
MTASDADGSLTQPPLTFWQECRNRRWLGVVVAALFALHGMLAVQTARYCSVTHDEYWHIPVGLLHWHSGQFDWENLNPPLMRMLAAVPLTATAEPGEITEPTDQIWSYGDDLVHVNRDNYRSLLIQARIPIVLLSMLTAWLLGCWATELFGVRSGVFAVLLWCVSPTVLASASLVTTDLGAAFFFVLSGWSVHRFSRIPNWKNTGLLGACLGLAQLAKYTSVILWPLSLIWCFLFAGASNPASQNTLGHAQSKPSTALKLFRWGVACIVSVIVLNLGYVCEGTGTPLSDYTFASNAMRAIQSAAGPLASLPVPAPSDWLEGIDHQRQMMEAKHPAFLNEQWSEDGFGNYYLYVLWYKLPHAVQLLTLIALWQLWRRRSDGQRVRLVTGLLLPVAVLLALASGSGMQLGIRYILPALPFLFLFVAGVAQWFPLRPSAFQRSGAVLCTVALLASVRHHPHHLAYFNELAGGPENGWNLLSDSNIDWGQDLYGLHEWVEANSVSELHLAWFGTCNPNDAGIEFTDIESPLLSGKLPRPGLYAVSVCLLQGRPTPIRLADGSQRNAGLDEFGWLRFFHPEMRIGHSLHVYRLTAADVDRLRTALQQRAPR